MDDGVSSVSSESEQEIIDVGDEDSDHLDEEEEDEDPLRDDFYEDYDELADLAVTASEEPPPPGTRPLQEELLTLITENTVSGVTINKDDVVAWLRNEEAALTGEGGKQRPTSPLYPSPPSSREEEEGDSDQSRLALSPPVKKSRTLSSVVAVRSPRESSRDRRERSRDRSSREMRGRSGDRVRQRSVPSREERIGSRSRETTPHRRDNRLLHSARAERAKPRIYHRHSPLTRGSSSRHSSPRRRGGDSRNTSPRVREERETRRVKVQHRVVDSGNKSPEYREIPVQTKRRPRIKSVAKKLKGVKDARELLSDRREPVHVTDYIQSLKDRILDNEQNARDMFEELQSAQQQLLDCISTAAHGRYREKRCRREDVRDEVRSRNQRRSREEPRSRDEYKSRTSSRDERRRHEHAERKQSRDHKRSSPAHKTRKSESHSGSEDPTKWKIIAPSEVDGYTAGGPAIFVQNFSRNVTRKRLYAYYSSFGSIIDIMKLDIARRRSACVIFSRQSEADKVLKLSKGVQDNPIQIEDEIEVPAPQSTFDLLLTALKREQPETSVG